MSPQVLISADVLVHHLFARTVESHREQTALVMGDDELSYDQLHQRAQHLALIIQQYAPEAALLGLSSTRSSDMVAGLLAILQASKAYLPLDPTQPRARLQRIIASAGLTTCLASRAEAPFFRELGLEVIPLEDAGPGLQERQAHGAARSPQLAYVLYTSGSTGEPKGVGVGHAPLVNLLHWQNHHSRAGAGTRTLQFAPLSFDVSFQEIFATLTTGGTLVLPTTEERLDLTKMLTLLEEQQVNRLFLPFVALQALTEAAVHARRFPAGLQEIMTAGEQLKVTPQLVAFFSALPGCVLYNQYGPTECACIVTQLQLEGAPATWPTLPTIGRPIANVDILITDEDLNPLPAGEVGELCIAGACLAEGYLHQPALTQAKFVYQQPGTPQARRLYRTGDVGRYLPDGTIELQGRLDDQVKIRGHRIELGEIEVALTRVAGIGQAVVVARETADGPKQLVAYLVSTAAPDVTALRAALEKSLPDYMMPAAFVWLAELPKSTSGKVDRKALPAPASQRPELAAPYRAAITPLEKQLTQLWSNLLQLDQVGLDDNFFELGGNSLLAQKTVAVLQHQHQLTLPITKLYQLPTAAGLARYFAQQASPSSGQPWRPSAQPVTPHPTTDVAVIGMAGRFPGANTVEELWTVLAQGRETTRFFTPDELDATIPPAARTDARYVPARGIIEHAQEFDAAFFGLNPKLAEVMDPQQRVFLEIAWEALEQAGYLPQTYGGRVGVFAGSGNNTYFLHNVLPNQAVIDQVGEFQAMTVNEKDYIASRTAYQLNLTGPAVSVYSACSTSLLAIAQAVQSLRAGQCEVALAGGVSITSPIHSGHLYQEGAMLSHDGHCRSFAAEAQGTVFSDGAGVVLLKSLSAAQQDGDLIYAIIKGVGVNNDGGGKGSFTAPSAEGQAGAIRLALQDARVAPATISYVEAHGTATPLGDPIEVEGLTMAFGEQARPQFCALGSIKSNMGHLTAAAGVAGFIKTALALQHQQLPASLGFTAPNPHIDFANSPFYVNTALTPWPAAGPRRAGVSSFGVGGTNVHVVLEEAAGARPAGAPQRPVQLITWSARSAASREAYARRLAECLSPASALPLADVAFTLHTTRPAFSQRRFAVVTSAEELRQALLTETVGHATAKAVQALPGETVFLFPGQGSQYLHMGRELYEQEPAYRQAVDQCAELLRPYLEADIRRVLYPEAGDTGAADRLRNTRYTQPALFVTEYALATLWMSWGIQPTVFCGHSIGEFVGAHLAGVFTLTDALRLIATRGRMVSELPGGSMLSVRLPATQIEAILPPNLSLAAVNTDQLCVVAGPEEDVAAFARMLESQDTPGRLLATSHAFHSAMMEPILADFREVLTPITLRRPQKPIVSTVTGTWLTDAQATDPDYWTQHLRATVQFAPALRTVLSLTNPLLLEVGPGNVTATLARQQAGVRAATILAGLPAPTTTQGDYQAILHTLGQLWLAGLAPDWPRFYAGQTRRKVTLPTYAFDRKRCWLAPIPRLAPVPPSTLVAPAPAPTPQNAPHVLPFPIVIPTSTMRTAALLSKVTAILEDASGIELAGVTPEMSFLEMGLDSLLLTQVSITLRKEFGLPITFRQLNEQYATLAQLTAYLDAALPAEAYTPVTTGPPAAPALPAAALVPAPVALLPSPAPASWPATDTALGLLAQQLQLIAQQIALLQAQSPASPILPPTAPPAAVAPAHPLAPAAELTPEEAAEIKKPFGATARIERQATALSAPQQAFLAELTRRYNHKTGASKAYAQQHRAHMADPRVVSGFKPLTKELVYPLVVNKSLGSRLWDIDGNEYIDALNGFGSSLLGYQPEVIKQALHAQIERGYEVGPQHELAGEVSQLICEFTGFDRAALCNTGSEAVLGTMRLARTVTGRSLIVAFSGSYHGIVDEVLVRGTKKLKSFPAAPGILPEAVQNMLILDYGTDESLRIIRERAHELAAVLVEPVQSRRPEFRPVAFLRQVREITAASGTALIFDEVITGFRMHPGGTQALFGIQADLACYGKVVGGGLSIGIIGGKKGFMDALDGGFWQYGDDSFPEVGVTYFAGTFVRHPLALAATKASLQYMQAQGPELQRGLTAKTERLAETLNAELERQRLPFAVVHFGSLWKIKFHEEIPYNELLFTLMREKGIHIWDGFPCFITEAHTEAEVDQIVAACLASAGELVAAGFLPASADSELDSEFDLREPGTSFVLNQPPALGAKLGRDPAGNPAWFVVDPNQPGAFLQLQVN